MDNIIVNHIENYDLNALINKIEQNFHPYFNDTLALIESELNLSKKINYETVPNLGIIHQLFASFKELLENHQKEESFILFPIIKEAMKKNNFEFKLFEKPINTILKEDEKLGSILLEIEKLSNNFNSPVNTSPAIKDCYQNLLFLKINYMLYSNLETEFIIPKTRALLENGLKKKSIIP